MTIKKDKQYFKDRSVIDTYGCWNWTGAAYRGYGKMKYKGNNCYSHRVSYEINIGPIEDGKCVCHKCDNPLCCNPEHLFIGTHQENTDDKIRKGRAVGGRCLGNNFRSKRIMILGTEYESYRDAGKHFGISDNGVKKRFKNLIKIL